MSTFLAFLRKDWLVWTSYRLAILWQLVGALLLIVLTYFIGGAVGHNSGRLNGEGQDYVAFILAGLAFTDVFVTGLSALPRAIRDGQMNGTLEPLLLTPLGTAHLVTASSVFALAQSLVRCLIFLAVGTVAFGYWHHADLLAAALLFVPGCLCFAALGLLSASFILVFKQGDPIVLGYAALSGLLGGSLFPVTSLPGWLRPFTGLLPLTHALTGIRLALSGAQVSEVTFEVGVLWLLTAGLLPLGVVAFEIALKRAKREGSLVQY